MKSTRETERKVNATVDEVLDDDEEDLCPEDCEQLDNADAEVTPSQEVGRQCKCAVENSWRFSLRVMEAMRSLQRDPDQPFTSTAEDIVEHIRANYRSDGDLYAQVRTALRQVCSQGFVEELFENEYHLIGPVAKSTRPSGCSVDCEGRAFSATTNGSTSRKRKNNDREADACDCRHSPGRNKSLRSPRSPRGHVLSETTFPVDHLEDLSTKDILHSTGRFMNDRRNDYHDERLDATSTARRERHPRRDDSTMEHKAKYVSPIPGPSRILQKTSPTPARRLKGRRASHIPNEENNEETIEEDEEEDPDCTCDTTRVVQEARARRGPRDRILHVVTGNHRDKRRRKDDAKEDEEEEMAAEEDEDAEDNVYHRLRQRGRPKRSATRERELRRWIRRCREECERRAR